eukprot:TRINITY_DN25102_c0_g1_i1.p1 TRINITY_DN25102_c0_g1~~TRINITY_DN25102_c0_g1_i1.p1  ORF type:complete len:483 (+),score=114.89 TRINITY_DN25102_c0_g1_i1:113-1561(+)
MHGLFPNARSIRQCVTKLQKRHDSTPGKLEEMWQTDAHKELSSLREKYFGRFSETAETLTGSKAMKHMSRDIRTLGGLKTLPHAVGVQPLVLRVSEIDELNQIARLEGYLMMKWHEEDLEEVPRGAELAAEDVSLPAFPRMSSAVTLEVKEPTSVFHATNANDPIGLVYATYEWKADIEVEFNLYHFPFDYQTIDVVLWFSANGDPRTADYGRFVIPLPTDESGKDPAAILPLRAAAAEWRLFSPTINSWTQSEKISKAPCRKQGVTLEIPILRKAEFYDNMMNVMCFIASLAFCAFASHPVQFCERLSATFSLLLALIAFKFSVADKLPKVAYLTAFDRYMDVTFGFLGLLAVYFALMKVWLEEKEKAKAKKLANNNKEDNEAGEESELSRMIPDWVHEPAEFERFVVLPTFLVAWVLYHVRLHRTQKLRGKDVKKALKSEIRRFKWRPPRKETAKKAVEKKSKQETLIAEQADNAINVKK